MIVSDADVISYFWLDVERTEAARAARGQDVDWAAPVLWRSEVRNVLAQHIQYRALSLSEAAEIARHMEDDLHDLTYYVPSEPVLRLAAETGHSAYDCEYVALAQQLDVPLLTGDQRLVERFPDTAILLEEYVP